MVCVQVSTVVCDGRIKIDSGARRDGTYFWVGYCTCGQRWTSDNMQEIKQAGEIHRLAYIIAVQSGILVSGVSTWLL